MKNRFYFVFIVIMLGLLFATGCTTQTPQTTSPKITSSTLTPTPAPTLTFSTPVPITTTTITQHYQEPIIGVWEKDNSVNQNRAVLTEYTFSNDGNCESQLIDFGERDDNPQPYGKWVKIGDNRYSAHWWYVNGDIIVNSTVYYIYEPGTDIMYEEEIRDGQPYRFPHPLKRAQP